MSALQVSICGGFHQKTVLVCWIINSTYYLVSARNQLWFSSRSFLSSFLSAHLPLQVGVALRRQTGDLTRQYLQVRDSITIAWLILPWSVLVLIYLCCFESLVEKKYKAFYVRVYRLPSGTHIHIYILIADFLKLSNARPLTQMRVALALFKGVLYPATFFCNRCFFSFIRNNSFTFHRYQLGQGPLGVGWSGKLSGALQSYIEHTCCAHVNSIKTSVHLIF